MPTDDLTATIARVREALSALDGHCLVCGWTLADHREDGCTPGDCSYRPSARGQPDDGTWRQRVLVRAADASTILAALESAQRDRGDPCAACGGCGFTTRLVLGTDSDGNPCPIGEEPEAPCGECRETGSAAVAQALSAMRWSVKLAASERDAAITRAERAEEALRLQTVHTAGDIPALRDAERERDAALVELAAIRNASSPAGVDPPEGKT